MEKSIVPNFIDVYNKMETLILRFQNIKREEINTVLNGKRGVYMFYENNEPVYVGKTDNLKRRLTEHGRAASKHNDANFAFKIAKLEWKIANANEKKITRNLLQEHPEFIKIFIIAKSRVSNMEIKFVEIQDPYEQYLFEFYAALHFKTKYNDFRNH